MNNNETSYQSDSNIFIRKDFFQNSIARILKHENISIIGEYQIGKTSFINSLFNELSVNKDYANYIPIDINLNKFQNEDEIFEQILTEIFEYYKNLKHEFPSFDIYNSDILEKFKIFNRAIKICNKNNIFLVLFIDHFDKLTFLKNLSEQFWSKLRANAETTQNIRFVTASRNRIKTLCHKGAIQGSHFWGIFSDDIFLIPLSDLNHISSYLNNGVNNDEVEYLYKITGGHPCFLKIATNIYLNNKSKKDYSQISDIIYNEIKQHFLNIIKLLEFDDKNLEVVLYQQNNYLKALKSYIKNSCFNEEKYVNELCLLLQKGYLKETDKNYSLFSPLFERFLIEYFDVMSNELPESYNGNDPFIFVSYTRSDTQIVYSQIKKLQKFGYRIWYDGGIEVSEKWRERINEKIKKCEKFLLFCSKYSCESPEVCKELHHFMVKKGENSFNKHLVMILLDDIKTFKSNIKDDSLEYVIDDLNGLSINIDEDMYQKKLLDALGDECKDGMKN